MLVHFLMDFYILYFFPIHIYIFVVAVVQSLSRVRLFTTPWTATYQAPLSFTISWSLLKLMSIELVMSSNHLILCCPLLLLPSVFPSTRVFTIESVLCTVAKVLGASASASVLQRIFRVDIRVFHLTVQGTVWVFCLSFKFSVLSLSFQTLKSFLQHHSLKASILWHCLLRDGPTLTSVHDY